jgi:fatty-acyl-CoA synthase
MGADRQRALLRSDDVYMPITPMFHVHAWGLPYVATMLGLKQVYPGRYDPEPGASCGARKRSPSPTACRPSCKCSSTRRRRRGIDFGGWKIVIGGSALTRCIEAAKAKGIHVYSGYGMSETCPLVSCAHLNDADLDGQAEDERTTSGSRPVCRGLWSRRKIVDADGNFLPADGETQGEWCCARRG